MKRLLDWFEDGDLVPLAVVISVAHYGPVLVAHGEHWLVAWAVGTMVDLLHFRSVRYAFTDRRWMAAAVAVATTIMATGYHLRFYSGDWLLALPIPIGIGILAWHASEQERGAVNDRVAAARQEKQAVEAQVQALESELQDAWEKLKEASKLVQAAEKREQDARQQAQEAEKRRKQIETALAQQEMGWQSVNPLARDVLHMIMTGESTQAEIARRHETSESTVSRLKASLNGGG